MKSSGPASLVEEILRQHQMKSLAWLLLVLCMSTVKKQQLGWEENAQILEEKEKGLHHVVW